MYSKFGRSAPRGIIQLVRAMKLTAFLLMITFMQVAAKGLSQNVTFTGDNVPLVKLFKIIKKQTGYAFFYNNADIENSSAVSVRLQNAPLSSALDEILEGQPLAYAIEGKTIVISHKDEKRRIDNAVAINTHPYVLISGNIRDEKGQPMSPVSVMVKGTNIGTVTSQNGDFRLEVSSNDVTLVISFLGYATQEVALSGRSTISITLVPEDQKLSEVVVTALGIERSRKALSYSTQVISANQLTQARETNVVNSLKGKVAGVHINSTSGGAGTSSFVVIRGNSSLTGNTQPLYVVDGVPIDNSSLGAPNLLSGKDYGDGVNNINPDDIENITVLKGPAAASIYGSRGANGVILITTRKGAKGKGVGVDLNSNATFEDINVLPTYQNVWGGGYDDNYTALNTITVDGQQYTQWPSWLIDNWGGKMDGRMIYMETWPELGSVPFTPQPTDRLKDFYRTGSTFTNSVGLSGGNANTTFRFSASDMRNTGIVPNSSLNRQTLNLRVSSNVTDKLSVEAKINYIRQKGKNRPENGISFNNVAASLNIIPQWVDLDWLKDYKRQDGSMTNYRSGVPFNPYWIVNEFVNNDARDRVIGFLLAKYKFNDWLSLQSRAGTDFYTDTRFSRVGVGTPSSDYRTGYVSQNEYHVREDNMDFLLSANRNLSPDITGSLSIGGNHMRRNNSLIGNTGTNLLVPGLYHISNAQLVTPINYLERKEINSMYFIGQFGYKEFLFLDVTGRNDWSSTLGKNNRSFFYPSISSSFVFTDAFNLNSELLSFGKVRASYAEAGTDADPYQTSGGYDLNSNGFGGIPFITSRRYVPLLDLKNELKRSYEFGTELRLFKNRLSVDFTYYSASTFNQILKVELSTATGFDYRVINAGEISNKGIEVFMTGNIIKTPAFKWDATINFSHNKSRVESLAENINTVTLIEGDGANIEARVGEAFGNIVGTKYKRTEDGQILLNDKGQWQPTDDRHVLGNIQPDFLAGVTNSFTWKGITVSALIDVRKGGQVYSFTKYDQMAKGTGKFTERGGDLIAEGVIDDGTGKYSPSTFKLLRQDYYAGRAWGGIGEEFVVDADYVTLREAIVGYDIGSTLLKKSNRFKTLRVSIVGRNLAYIYRDQQFKTMGISPETAFAPTAAAQGYEARGIPTTRSIGVNLSLSF
jgi:TonB-linked SusC/RagA family outer membrane protein